MVTIYKQILKPDSIKDGAYKCEFIAPKDIYPLSVGLQNGNVCLWYECDPSKPSVPTHIFCVGTGFGAVPKGRFLGTVVNDPYAWHFYDPFCIES